MLFRPKRWQSQRFFYACPLLTFSSSNALQAFICLR
jgi:hypothetical protein